MCQKWTKIQSVHAAAVVVLSLSRNLGWFMAALSASTSLNLRMMCSVMHAKLEFFHTTPTGRILNVFTKDQGTTDELLVTVRCPLLSVSAPFLASFLYVLRLEMYPTNPCYHSIACVSKRFQ